MLDVSAPHLPLFGVRVLDITVVWAGPHCTQLLAEWGAEVIRLEPLHVVQPNTRGAENLITREIAAQCDGTINAWTAFPDHDPLPRQWNRSPAFNSHARNKRSMTINVTALEGKAVFRDLVAISDVIVENNVPETVERAGFTYEDVVAANPGIIVLRMPAYGLSGPYKNYRSFGTHMEGMTGHHYLRSYPHLDPSMTGDAFTVDAASGVMGAFAVMMALRHRRRTGEGQLIELPQAENFLGYLGEYVLDYSMNGRSPSPQGNHHPSHAPHGVYPCRLGTAGPPSPPMLGGDRSDAGMTVGPSALASSDSRRGQGAGSSRPEPDATHDRYPPSIGGEGEAVSPRPGEGGAVPRWPGEAWIAIDVGSDEEWRALSGVMGQPDRSRDERFATTLGRWHHREELDALLGEWTRTQDSFELFHRLQAAGVTAGPVQNERDVYACPQLNERGFFEPLTHPEAGTHRYPGFVFRMANTPNHLRRHPAMLGEDNDYVYRNLLALSDGRYRELRERGHIGTDYPSRQAAAPAGAGGRAGSS